MIATAAVNKRIMEIITASRIPGMNAFDRATSEPNSATVETLVPQTSQPMPPPWRKTGVAATARNWATATKLLALCDEK